ncbi:acetyl-CoA acetyltransferase [Rhodococcus sp. WB9]|uniref:acetyl-CoA acetyltransferase n=1 Tax=Rhodococcus sp. WB9 TaxID=2594007 RepID=UPI0011864C43|nr:acetyl-CoA acetyltransferase [Rhodococcus sp. WB9]QDQ91246.1 acetyl-CoA acetyltransferase [Rhodococcus sp. WB9]
MDPARIPVIVGVDDIRSGRAGDPAAPREPLDLITDAARAALADSGSATLGSRIDAIHAVKTVSWSYDDLPGLLAVRLNLPSPRSSTSPIGGHWPATLLDRIGDDIASGRSSAALLVGGESQATMTALRKSGTDPTTLGWASEPGGPPAFDPADLGSPAMQRADLIVPTRVYPLFENRVAHESGVGPDQSLAESARMYSAFSELAAKNPASWTCEVYSAEEIATVGPGNRMVCEPYPLMLNAMPFVDQAAAVLVCSLAVAREHGVPEDRTVYLWGGAGAADPVDVLSRNGFGTSTAMTDAVHRALSRASIDASALDIVDAYSCFPVVPKLLTRTLGLPASTVPSVTGGHSFFGGPLNSYTLHSIAEVTRRLREGAGPALVHGNGGYLTYQHVVMLAGAPHPDGYVGDPEPAQLASEAPELVTGYEGRADLVTSTVEYGRDGAPATGFVVAHTPDGRRLAGRTGPAEAVALSAFTETPARSVIGRTVHVTDRDGILSLRF